jgi:hypothetical protein
MSKHKVRINGSIKGLIDLNFIFRIEGSISAPHYLVLRGPV